MCSSDLFAERSPIPLFYQVHLEPRGDDTEWPEAKARILPFTRFCELLKL